MPHFGLYHVGMQVRLTQTLEAPYVVVDTTGTICGFEFAPEDRDRGDLDSPFVVLRHLPQAIFLELHDVEQAYLPASPCSEHISQAVTGCPACTRSKKIFLVRPFTNQRSWSLTVALPNPSGLERRDVQVKVRRTQIPLVTIKASTLHVLQGTTTDPGLIFHWCFPRRLQGDMRWLATYVALSRVRSLARLRSIGLDNKIRDIIESGPPDTLPARFAQLFAEKEAATQTAAAQALRMLGWT